jgi:hypothetical protein
VQKHLATYLSTGVLATPHSVTLNIEPESSISPEAVKPLAIPFKEELNKMILNPPSGGVFVDQNRATGPSDLDLNQVYNPEVVDSPVKEADVPKGLRSFIDRVVRSSRCQHSEDAEALKSILGLELPSVTRLKLALVENNTSSWRMNPFVTRRRIEQNDYVTEINPKLVPLWKVIKDIVTCIVIYGYRDTFHSLYNRMLITFIHWCCLAKEVEDNFIKVAKYKLAAFASWAKGSTMFPKNPFERDLPSNIFDQTFTIFISKFVNNKKKDLQERLYLMSLTDSICRGIKKGADRPGSDLCHQSCLATFKLFTRPDKPKLEYEIENPMLIRNKVDKIDTETMKREIRRSIDELLQNAPDYEPAYNHTPSFSSGTLAPVKDGGQCRVVKESLHYKDHPHYRIKVKQGLFDGLKLKPVNPYPNDDTIPLPHEVELEEIYNPTCSKYVEMDVPDIQTDLDIAQLTKKCLSEPSVISPIGLAEALKVRGITTPNPLETWLLKPLQKYLAKRLLNFHCFAVTGTPLEPKHLNDAFKRSDDSDGPFCSGDYDNATNEMNSCYTREAILYVCEKLGLDADTTRLAERSLVDNYIVYKYKDKDGEHLLEGQQTEGQPMGKILSFVILCIINFTVCRMALEIDRGKKISLKKFPGLINGDDCCFRIKNFDVWVGVSSCVGLFNSIGKTFYSSEFVEMNSRSFLFHDGTFIETPFINFGLIRMMKRSEQSIGKGAVNLNNNVYDFANMGACHRDLLMGLHSIYEEVDHLFIHEQRSKLESKRLLGIPHYIPAWLGGLGLDPGPRPNIKITDAHRVMASIIYSNIEAEPLGRVSKVKNCKLNDLVNETFKNALNRVKPIPLKETTSTTLIDEENRTRDLDKENQYIYNSILELLWRNCMVDDFFISPTEEGELEGNKLAWRKLNRTQRLWKNAYTQLIFDKNNDIIIYCKSQLLPWHKLWHQKQQNAFPVVRRRDNIICVGDNCICCRYERHCK